MGFLNDVKGMIDISSNTLLRDNKFITLSNELINEISAMNSKISTVLEPRCGKEVSDAIVENFKSNRKLINNVETLLSSKSKQDIVNYLASKEFHKNVLRLSGDKEEYISLLDATVKDIKILNENVNNIAFIYNKLKSSLDSNEIDIITGKCCNVKEIAHLARLIGAIHTKVDKLTELIGKYTNIEVVEIPFMYVNCTDIADSVSYIKNNRSVDLKKITSCQTRYAYSVLSEQSEFNHAMSNFNDDSKGSLGVLSLILNNTKNEANVAISNSIIMDKIEGKTNIDILKTNEHMNIETLAKIITLMSKDKLSESDADNTAITKFYIMYISKFVNELFISAEKMISSINLSDNPEDVIRQTLSLLGGKAFKDEYRDRLGLNKLSLKSVTSKSKILDVGINEQVNITKDINYDSLDKEFLYNYRVITRAFMSTVVKLKDTNIRDIRQCGEITEKNIVKAIPLIKVQASLLEKILKENKEIHIKDSVSSKYRGTSDEMHVRGPLKQLSKYTIISNEIFKQDSIRRELEYTDNSNIDLSSPIMIHNVSASDAYNKEVDGLLDKIAIGEFTDFFMLMLVVHNNNVSLQLWDRAFFVKELKAELIPSLRYLENSSDGIPYKDKCNGKLVSLLRLDTSGTIDNTSEIEVRTIIRDISCLLSVGENKGYNINNIDMNIDKSLEDNKLTRVRHWAKELINNRQFSSRIDLSTNKEVVTYKMSYKMSIYQGKKIKDYEILVDFTNRYVSVIYDILGLQIESLK